MKFEARKINTVQGVARFQKIEKPANKNLIIRLDADEVLAIKTYCKQYNISQTNLIKKAIQAEFISKGFKFTAPIEDTNQTKMF